ncbi:MAG: hypothetical protein EOO73_00805 [Myxococcales bacterium]|nr:MAG: hypothetical protein EOO73_00805 [Myxococcales bacterium]
MRAKSLYLLSLLMLSGCQKDEPKPDTTRKEAEAPAKVDAIDPSLAEAVAAASASPARAGVPGQAEGGPPADGVFGPGAADKEATKGAAPKITLGSDGSEPRQKLGPSKPAKLTGTIQLALQSDPRQGAIPVLLSLAVEPKKADAKDAEGSQVVTVRVTGAKVDAPGVPKEMDDQVAKVKGSKVEYTLSPNGTPGPLKVAASKGAPEDFVRSLSDALGLLSIPYPDKPLGAGGFFMVTSRDELMGMDLVTYRMVKVKEVTPEGVTLDVNTKRYAASRTLELPGMPPDMDKNLFQFDAMSEGTVRLPLGAVLPTQGEINSVLAAQFAAADPKRRPAIQLQSRAQLDLK